MDILAITETTENQANSFLTNVNIDGFKPPLHTPSLSAKGGTALYVNSNFESFERLDLRAQTDNFESVWVEIKNRNSKNIICGCVYRHPRYDMDDFLLYMENVLKTCQDENKE